MLEGLADPGDWYWDSATSTVSLVAVTSSTERSARVGTDDVIAMAPQLDQLLMVQNTKDVSVTDIEFRHAGAGDRVNTYATLPPFINSCTIVNIDLFCSHLLLQCVCNACCQ